MRIQVLKDEDETVYQGYYHNQWDTQMGEESFGDNAPSFCLLKLGQANRCSHSCLGDVTHMNDEQLATKKTWWAAQVEEVEKEVKKRGLTIAELKRLEPANQPRPYGGDDNDDDEEDEDADGEEGDDDDYRADNYRGYDYNHDYTRSQGGTQDPDDGDGEDVRSPI